MLRKRSQRKIEECMIARLTLAFPERLSAKQ